MRASWRSSAVSERKASSANRLSEHLKFAPALTICPNQSSVTATALRVDVERAFTTLPTRLDMNAFIFGSAIELLIGFSGFLAWCIGTAFSHFRHTQICGEAF